MSLATDEAAYRQELAADTAGVEAAFRQELAADTALVEAEYAQNMAGRERPPPPSSDPRYWWNSATFNWEFYSGSGILSLPKLGASYAPSELLGKDQPHDGLVQILERPEEHVGDHRKPAITMALKSGRPLPKPPLGYASSEFLKKGHWAHAIQRWGNPTWRASERQIQRSKAVMSARAIQRASKAVMFARPESDAEKEALAEYKTLTTRR
jgi:hypothetical protein